MVTFPNAKINIGLKVLGKRADGFHEIESLLFPVGLCDILEAVPSSGKERVTLHRSGLEVPGKPEDDLCIRLFRLLEEVHPASDTVLYLHKLIPAGSGLGGGSSDAAFLLRVLDRMNHIDLSREQALELLSSLGSDLPFFYLNTPCLVKGRGERLSLLPIDLSGYHIVLLFPGIHISTARAYQQYQPATGAVSPPLQETLQQVPVEEWKDHVFNDLEKSVFPEHPLLQELKAILYDAGALYASMTGSGSALYGIFREAPSLPVPLQQYLLWKGPATAT